MIINRGALAEALERWNERRRRIFYPKTDLDFDLQALRQRKEALAHANLTDLALLLDQEVSNLEPLANAGTFHALFNLQVSGKECVLKLSLEEPAFAFAIESWAMSTLRSRSLPSLTIEAFNVLRQPPMPAPYLIMEKARGKPLNQFEHAETQVMPEPLLFELGILLARIHSIEAAGAGLLDVSFLPEKVVGLHEIWADYILLRLDEHLRTCLQIRAINSFELVEIEKHFSDYAPLLLEAPIRLLQGDPGHHNIFSDGQKITAIIDWEDALCGDPIFEIAYWGTFVRDEMPARFLEGYQSVKSLPADFEQRYWLYYLRVAISKTVHRHHFGAKDRPGRPPASQRIQKALSKLAEL